MPAFEDIKPGARLRGLDPASVAEVVQVARFGADALNLVFRANGRVGERLVYRGEESSFELVDAGRTFAFEADGALFRLASEAYRVRLAYLFDPYFAVTASSIEALPHQITAVYDGADRRNPDLKGADALVFKSRFGRRHRNVRHLFLPTRGSMPADFPAGLDRGTCCISQTAAQAFRRPPV